MNPERLNLTAGSYDDIAAEYAHQLYRELDSKPMDRATLDRFADRLRGRGTVCDMGCGPGHVGRYLVGRGLDVIGVDLSPGMVAQAAALNPDIAFHQGNILAMDWPDDSWAGIAAFYSIIHIPRDAIFAALNEMRRVLRPGGSLLLAFHTGDADLRETEVWGISIDLEYTMYGAVEMTDNLRAAGFEIVEVTEREPYAPEVEYQSRRAYILARKPEQFG
jgi:SAM-dependent methyltransferase